MKKPKHIQGNKGIKLREKIRGIPYDQVLVVSIDPGKFFPKALICNFFGEIITQPFFFHIDTKGFKILLDNINAAIKSINAQKVLVGIEASGHYHQKVVRFLESKDYDISIINAYTTSEIRSENLNWSKTDNVDLFAIADAITKNKITQSYLPEGIYKKLLFLTRERRREVDYQSSTKIKIRTYMDHIWPNFQGKSLINNNTRKVNKIFSDFWGKSSVFIMRNYPHPTQVLNLGKKGLRKISKQHCLKMRDSTIDKLLHAAQTAYTQPPEALDVELTLLNKKLNDLKKAQNDIAFLEEKIEAVLVKTPGVLLLSARGIGITIAAEFTAELGPVDQYNNPSQIIKKAGTNPIVKESGGKKPIYGSISKQGNPKFRQVVYTAGQCLKKHNLYFKEFANRLKSKGKCAGKINIACGNKFIKVAYAMLRKREFFHPPKWEGEPLTYNPYKKLTSNDNIIEARKTLLKELKLDPEKFAS